MAELILVTGGSRSGKSSHAQKTAESIPGRRAFIATCPVIDAEMDERVRKHRQARVEADWDTIEETVDLASVIRRAADYDVLLIDCLTLWINNLMYEAERKGEEITEEDVSRECDRVISACTGFPGTVIMVTNEVGMGIVPDNPLSRRYRDLVGRCNQAIGSAADEVTLVVCGVPMNIKQRKVI